MSTQLSVFNMAQLFDAPIDKVWDAWTIPENLGKWFSPKGVKSVYSKLDLRAGGFYHYGLQNPDGSKYWGRWMITDVSPKTRLEFILSFSDEKMGVQRHPLAPTWPAQTQSTILFKPAGEKTGVEVQWKPHNATPEEIATFNAGLAGMKGGWGGTFEQLAAFLKA
jgi:uncharacterized protein YndB with AHSA1/START domain